MKKIFAILSALVLVFALAVPLIGGAQVSPGSAPEGCTLRMDLDLKDADGNSLNLTKGMTVGPDSPDYSGEDWAIVCMLHTVYYVINWVFYIIIIAVGIMILSAAFMYLTAGGNADKAKTANKIIVYAVIGLVIALVARAIPAAVRYIVGM